MSADGNWKAVANSPMGKQPFTLTVKSQGDSFTGSLSSQMGSQDITGKISGETLTWTLKIEQPMSLTLEYTAQISGDKMTGTIKAGAFGSSPFEGTRA